MLYVNEDNAEIVKRFKFSLRAFMDIHLDLPIEKSIKMFGQENTYRYNVNLTMDDLPSSIADITTRDLTMCFKNDHLKNMDIIDRYGHMASVLLNRWERILSTKLTVADAIMVDYTKLRLHRITPELFHDVLDRVYRETPKRLFEVTRKLTRIDNVDDLAELAIKMPHHLPQYFYDALVIDEKTVQKLNKEYNQYPRVASLLMSNLPQHRWSEIIIPDDVEVGAAVAINLNLDRDITDETLWEGISHYNPIRKIPDLGKLMKVIEQPTHYNYHILGNFEPKVLCELITQLLNNESVSARAAEELLAVALELVYMDVEFSKELSDYLVSYAIGNNEQRGYWKLYLSTNLPEEFKSDILGKLTESH